MTRNRGGHSGEHENVLARGRNGAHGSAVEVSYHRGPLPSAEEIAKYEAVYPGAAEIIFQGFKSQVEHRQHLERTVIEANVRAQRLSPILGTALAGLIIIGGFAVVLVRGDAYGYAAILTAGATLVGTALWIRSAQAKERKEKEEALAKRAEA